MRAGGQLISLVSLLLLGSLVSLSDSGAVQLDPSNIDAVLANNEFVFINFYADWCRFSNLLAPVWDEGAEKIAAEVNPNLIFFSHSLNPDPAFYILLCGIYIRIIDHRKRNPESQQWH